MQHNAAATLHFAPLRFLSSTSSPSSAMDLAVVFLVIVCAVISMPSAYFRKELRLPQQTPLPPLQLPLIARAVPKVTVQRTNCTPAKNTTSMPTVFMSTKSRGIYLRRRRRRPNGVSISSSNIKQHHPPHHVACIRNNDKQSATATMLLPTNR